VTVSGSGGGGWLDATSVAEGNPSAEAQAQQRRSRRRRVALFLIVLALPFIGFGVLAATGTRLPDLTASQPSTILITLAVVLSVVGVILVVVGIVRLIRAGMLGQAWRSPILSLDRRERRLLVRRIRHVEAVPGEQFAVAADFARRIAGQGPLLLILGGLACNLASQALANSTTFLRWVFVFLFIGQLVVLMYARDEIRRAKRWLEQNPTGSELRFR
jgi:hypothetical protein